MTPLSRFPRLSSSLVGVYSNYLECIYKDTYVPTKYYPNINETKLKNDRRRNGISDLYTFDNLTLRVNLSKVFEPVSN